MAELVGSIFGIILGILILAVPVLFLVWIVKKLFRKIRE